MRTLGRVQRAILLAATERTADGGEFPSIRALGRAAECYRTGRKPNWETDPLTVNKAARRLATLGLLDIGPVGRTTPRTDYGGITREWHYQPRRVRVTELGQWTLLADLRAGS